MRYIKSYANDAAIQEAVDNKSLGKPYVALNESAGTIDWDSKEIDPAYEYFTIKALESGNFYVRNANVGYSVNGADWETTAGSTTLALNSGDAVRFRHISTGGGQLGKCFSGNTTQFEAYGNVESLEYGDDFVGKTGIKISAVISGDGAFASLFQNSTGLVSVEHLKLPATAGATYCYAKMFYGCNQIKKAPDILISNLGGISTPRVYQMFTNCSQLSYVKCLATQNTNVILNGWLSGVSATGTFVKAAGRTYKSGSDGIPSGWTVIEE